MALKDDLVAAMAAPVAEDEVNGVKVRLRGLGMGDQFELDSLREGDATPEDVTYFIISKGIIDDDDNPVFEPDDEALRGLSGKEALRLFNRILKLSGIEAQAKN